MTGKPAFRFCLLICVLFVAACTVRLETARLESPDLTFSALDGSSKVGPGQGLRIPKDTPYCYDNVSGSFGSIFRADTPIAAQPDVGRKQGGDIVRIDIAGEPKPLYGLLLFCSKPSSALEYKSLSTYAGITIPEKHRAIARSGRVASVQRKYKFKRDLTGGKIWLYSWILWLADNPEKLNVPVPVSETAVAQAGTKNSPARYVNAELGFSITLPKGWTYIDIKKKRRVVLNAPYPSGDEKGEVIINYLGESKLSLESAAINHSTNLRNSINREGSAKISVVKFFKTPLASGQFAAFIFEKWQSTEYRDVSNIYIFVYTLIGNKLFRTSTRRNVDYFEKMEPDLKSIIDSFAAAKQ